MAEVNLPLDQLLPPIVVMHEDPKAQPLAELAEDIRRRGLLAPIIVTPHDGKWRVVAGERRRQACLAAGLIMVKCNVLPMTESDELETMAAENLHREQTSPVEEGRIFATLQEGLGLSAAAVAARVGKSESYVGSRLAITYGPEDVREALRAELISFSVARELLRCPHEEDRRYLIAYAQDPPVTADTMRRWVSERNLARAAAPAAPVPADAPATPAVSEVLMRTCEWHLGTVPLESTLSFVVCGNCYRALLATRDRIAAEQRAEERGETHVESREPGPTATG